MKHKQGILFAVATFLLGRSRRTRWAVPVLPLALTLYRKAMARRGIRDGRMRAAAGA